MTCKHNYINVSVEWVKGTKTIFTGMDAGGDEAIIRGKRIVIVCKDCGILSPVNEIATEKG